MLNFLSCNCWLFILLPYLTLNCSHPEEGKSAMLLNCHLGKQSVKKNMALSSQGPWWLKCTRRSSKLSRFSTICLAVTSTGIHTFFHLCWALVWPHQSREGPLCCSQRECLSNWALTTLSTPGRVLSLRNVKERKKQSSVADSILSMLICSWLTWVSKRTPVNF